MSYRYTRNKHSKLLQETKPHNDLSKKRHKQDFFDPLNLNTDYGTRTYDGLPAFDRRSPVKKRNAYRRTRATILKSGYRTVIGTIEQDIFVIGPSRGVWNKVESL